MKNVGSTLEKKKKKRLYTLQNQEKIVDQIRKKVDNRLRIAYDDKEILKEEL